MKVTDGRHLSRERVLTESQRQRAEMEIREALLIDEILTVGKGHIYMSLSPDLAHISYHGFQTIGDKELYIEEGFDYELTNKMKTEKRLEGVIIEPKMVDIMQEKEIKSARKGIFGIGKRPAQYQSYQVGLRNALFSELVHSSDIHESAYLLSYLVNAPADAPRNKGAGYQDYSHRYGQFLSFKILIPKSLLEKISSILQIKGGNIDKIEKVNIEFIRKLAKECLKKKLVLKKDVDFEQSWEYGDKNNGIPLKPPYSFYDENNIKPIIILRT